MVIFYLCFLFFFVMSSLVFFWFNWMKRNLFSKDREKSSSFECGFDGNKSNQNPFSFRFFYILIIFLIFDIELSLFLVLPYKLIFLKFYLKFIMIFCLMILFFGLLEEWRRGTLKWKK